MKRFDTGHSMEVIERYWQHTAGTLGKEASERQRLCRYIAQTVATLNTACSYIPTSHPHLQPSTAQAISLEIRRLCSECNRILLALEADQFEMLN